MSEESDILIVQQILNLFLKQRSTQQKLQYICGAKVNGWEKWFQIELQHFISTYEGVTVYKEVGAVPDRRKIKNKTKLYVDLAFEVAPRDVGDSPTVIFLELKCTKYAQALINGFEKDIRKVNSIRSCQLSHQSLFCVGFHLNCTERSVEQMVKYIDDRKLGHHQVFKFCGCRKNTKCRCVDNKIGFAII